MKNIVALISTFLAISAFADRTANQEWVKRNFAPTNIVPRVEALENGSTSGYLSIWDCSTGLPITNPTSSNYTYKTGDFYIVGNVSTNFLYKHSLVMSGLTQGDGDYSSVYTNLTFCFTNGVSKSYDKFKEIVFAANEIGGSVKSAFPATGKLVTHLGESSDIAFIAPLVFGQDDFALMLEDSEHAAGTNGTATNAFSIVDIVSLVDGDNDNAGRRNFKPSGLVFTNGVASLSVEQNRVSKNDTYYFDGTKWNLLSSPGSELPNKWALDNITNKYGTAISASDIGATSKEDAKKIALAMKPVKIGNYLWEVGTEGEDFTKCTNRMAKVYPSYGGGCSGVCAGKYHGRNLDWGYNKEVSIVVRSPANESKFGAIGIVGGISAFTDEFLESEQWSEAFYSMPFTWSDGINDKGVVIQQNVVQTNFVKSAAWRTNSTDKIICFCIIRYALDRCSTAEEAANLICSKVFVPSEFAYDFHYLVSDKTSSFIVEDGVVLASTASRPTDVMTNFRVGGTTAFNDDKTVNWETVETYGIGLERYDLIRTNGVDKTTIDGMIKTMKALWYSNTYKESTVPFWYTEHCDPTKPTFTVMNAKNNQSIFDEEKVAWAALYNDEHNKNSQNYRKGETWQTIHTAIYDKENLSLLLFTQEDENSGMVFSLKKYDDGLFGISASDVSDIREMIEGIGDLPIGGGFTTLGGLLAALIAAVVWLKKNKANKTDTISGVNLNGTDLTIDTNTRKATGLVKSTLPIPDSISSTKMTSLEFCRRICDLDTCKVGVIYCGYSQITDAPCTGCEVTVSVMKDESAQWGNPYKVLVLHMNSTNTMEKGWVPMYHYVMKYGTNDCPWETQLTVPVIRTPGTYTLECNVTDGSVTYQWVSK